TAKYGDIRIRDFNPPTGEHRIRTPNLRLLHSGEVRTQLADLYIPTETGSLMNAIEQMEAAVPEVFERASPQLTYSAAEVRPSGAGRNQWFVNLLPNEATTEYLQSERDLVLHALMNAIGHGDTDLPWQQERFEIRIATAPISHLEETVQRVANIAMSHGPLEITLNPAQFSPDPRLTIQ
ncbi:MAG: hypothetical protein ABWX94_01620, partial [Candidatus Saccharimonadales bacterium]